MLTAAVALGVGQLVSGLTARQGSPAVVVGQEAIDLAPPPVKNFAISAFGANDKTVLIGGILVVLAVFAALIGVAAMRRLAYGYAGLVLFAAIGLAAAVSRPGATSGYVVPTIFGAAAGAFTLNRLTRAALAATAPSLHPGARPSPRPAVPADRYAGFEGGVDGGFDAGFDGGFDAGLAGPGHAGPGSVSTTPISPPASPPPSGSPASSSPPSPPSPPSPSPAASPSPPHSPDSPPSPFPASPSASSPSAASSPSSSSAAASSSSPPAASSPSAGTPAEPAMLAAARNRPDDHQVSGPTTADTWTYRPSAPGRRRFLVASGVAAGGAALAALAGRELNARQSVAQARSTLRIPAPSEPAPPLAAGTDLHIPGLSSFITPDSSFYRVDTAIVLPEVDPAHWQLHIHGMVEREITISFAELLRKPLIEHYVTLTCVSNPVSGPYIGNAKWLGASLSSIIRSARPKAGASQLLCTSVDGFTSGTPIQVVLDGREALLAVAMNGTALPVEHGFPARMVVPGLYGYVSATKWVTDINVTTYEAETSYWAQRGWSQQAPIKTESRIDVPADGSTIRAGRAAVAGVAWAQHKGIDAVEARVDQGPWQQATLAAVPGIDTWRQWVWYWDATPGTHVIEARATDATGYTQTAVQVPTEPNGATGYPSNTTTVRA